MLKILKERTMRKRLISLLAAAALIAAGGVLAVTGPALADSYISCSSVNTIRFADTSNAEDTCITVMSDAAPVGVHGDVSPHNWTSYIINNTGHRWYVFRNSTCSGTVGAGTAGIIYPNTYGAMTYPWDNSIQCAYRSAQTN